MLKELKLKEKIILLLILLLALFLRSWNLPRWDNPAWQHDEIGFLLESISMLDGRRASAVMYVAPFIGRYLSLPALVFTQEIDQALFFARIIRVLFGMATILLIFILTKEFYDKRTAFIASFLLAIFSSHIYISREAMHTAPVVFFSVLFFYFLYKFISTRKEKFLYISSLTGGMGVLTQLAMSFFLFPVLIFSLIFYKAKFTKKAFFISFLIFMLTISPLFVIIYKETNFVFSRFFNIENTNLLNFGKNLYEGIFLRFPSFLGGDISNYEGAKPSYFFLISLLLFIFICLKNKNKKDVFLLSSLIIGIILVSTVTVTTLRTKTFYVAIPFIVIVSSRAVSVIYEKCGKITLLIFLLIIPDFIPIFHTISKSYVTLYPFCIEEVVDNVISFEPSSVFLTVWPTVRHPMKYRFFYLGEGGLVQDGKKISNTSIFVLQDSPDATYEIRISDLSRIDFHPLKNIECEQYNITYHINYVTIRD